MGSIIARIFFNSFKKRQNPFAFYQNDLPIRVINPKIIVEVLYEAETISHDYYRYGQVALDLSTHKIVNKKIKVSGKLPHSFVLQYYFAVKVYIDLDNFKGISPTDYITVTYKNHVTDRIFKGYYPPEPIPAQNIKLGLSIPLDFFDVFLERKVFF